MNELIATLTVKSHFEQEGSTHFYALSTDEGVVLVDCGYNNDTSWEALTQGLRNEGRDVSEVRAVLLSHAHGDHMGLLGRLRRECDVAVYVHESERNVFGQPFGQWVRNPQCTARLLIEHGAPRELVERQLFPRPGQGDGHRGGSHLRRELEPDLPASDGSFLRTTRDGDILSFGDTEITVIHTPGHSPGSVVYWHAASQTLFSGDHIFQRITPNPIIYFEDGACEKRTRSLPDYLASLEKLRGLPARRVLPAHGAMVDNLQKAIDRTFHLYHQRTEKVFQALEGRPLTAYELLPVRFPNLKPGQFGSAMTDVIGRLDTLVDQGRVVEERRDGLCYYRALNGRHHDE